MAACDILGRVAQAYLLGGKTTCVTILVIVWKVLVILLAILPLEYCAAIPYSLVFVDFTTQRLLKISKYTTVSSF